MAALMVVALHLPHIANLALPSGVQIFDRVLAQGVQLFFVMSAFSLAHSHHFDPVPVPAYLIKRFFRIAPLFYAMLTLYLIRTFYFTDEVDLSEAFLNYTFLFALAPGWHTGIVWAGWAIGVEMIFYVLLPIILFCCRRTSHFALLFVLSLAAAIAFNHLLQSAPPSVADLARYGIGTNLPMFAGGLLAQNLYQRYLGGRAGAAVAAVVVATAIAAAAGLIDDVGPSVSVDAWSLVAWSTAFSLLCLWQAQQPSWVMASALFQYLGERSYSIYLLHPYLIWCIKPMLQEATGALGNVWGIPAAFALTLAIVLLTAELTYRLIELPGIGLGRSLARRITVREAERIDHR